MFSDNKVTTAFTDGTRFFGIEQFFFLYINKNLSMKVKTCAVLIIIIIIIIKTLFYEGNT